jgi:hypothetical protein
MSSEEIGCTIVFPDWYDERARYEHSRKGHLYGVIVRFADSTRYQVSFIDPIRLRQEIEDELSRGASCFLEPALIVVPEVTPEAIHKALPALVRQSFFEHLKPEV